MNILQISASDNSAGGASRIAMDLHTGIIKTGATARMFAGDYSSGLPEIEKIKKTTWDSMLSHLGANDSAYYKTDYLLETEKFKNADIVHAHNIHGWYFNLGTLEKMSTKKPFVWTLHDMWAVTPHCAHAPGEVGADGFFTCASRSDYPALLWPNEAHLKKQKKQVYEAASLTLVAPCNWLEKKC